MGRPLVPVDLNIPFFNQETDMWCWAAVSQMVIAHFKGIDATPPQREIARMALGEDAERWRDGVPDDAIAGHSTDFIRLTVKVLSRRASEWYPPPQPEAIYANLYFGNPVILHVRTGHRMSHVMVVGGIRPGDARGDFEVCVNDPAPHLDGPFWARYEAVRPSVLGHMIVYRDVKL